ncbi:VOC family protein [Tabrizicola aquatica]|uniref:VOC family protein n=1 Tax=Tabrizicola aquatica TaxID=909926 RepID=UPI000CD1F4DD|nr:VOC family protein [Tabrizicola aquatica]
MIGYVTVGVDDIENARQFYSAFLPRLGYDLDVSDEGLGYSLSRPSTLQNALPDLYVRRPFDDRPASAGNGTMIAFQVPTQALLRDLHAAALSAGGQDDGAPGFRAAYGAGFYVGYLRDPQGNKIALYCDNLAEPRRAG